MSKIPNRDVMRQLIIAEMRKIAEEQGLALIPELPEATVLLESGLDSMGFAVLVTGLEEELGWDPFAEATEAFYPSTVAEFIDYYFEFSQKKLVDD